MTNSGYRSLRSRKTIGWQAEAPAPPKRKPPRAKVGQALSPVNPAVSAILIQLLRERLHATKNVW
jgi:hypothetical protein